MLAAEAAGAADPSGYGARLSVAKVRAEAAASAEAAADLDVRVSLEAAAAARVRAADARALLASEAAGTAAELGVPQEGGCCSDAAVADAATASAEARAKVSSHRDPLELALTSPWPPLISPNLL